MSSHYFAMDGNYGSSDGLLIVDTTNWTEAMWERMSEATDSDRLLLAPHFESGTHEWDSNTGLCFDCVLGKGDVPDV